MGIKQMSNQWKEAIMSLPDLRLSHRLEYLVEQLSQNPHASIPQACGSVHEAKAAYRFLG